MVTVTLRPLYPREGTPLRFEQEAGWASQSVWTFWRRGSLLLLQELEPRTSS